MKKQGATLQKGSTDYVFPNAKVQFEINPLSKGVKAHAVCHTVGLNSAFCHAINSHTGLFWHHYARFASSCDLALPQPEGSHAPFA